MKPQIDSTEFGSITIDGETYDHDVVIRLSGKVKKRKKKLSKQALGTSHIISLEEAMAVYEDGAEIFVFGTGQEGVARLSDEAAAFLSEKGCEVKAVRTPDAVNFWNNAKGKVIGLFHITC
jgi:hypothetical protein